SVLRRHVALSLFAVVLMSAMLFFSHGSQDLYPSQFLKSFHGLSHATVVTMMVIYNLGAIAGGLCFGTLSQRLSRRWALMLSALLALPAIPFWAFGHSVAVLAAGGFVLQFAVQGAWGVIPAFLNELSPPAIRGTFPGTVYQLGNLVASPNANLQVWLADRPGSDIRWALAIVIATVAVVVSILALLTRDTRAVRMGRERIAADAASDL
ncbi:MAG: MFS transporter, partial [Gluconacetobacter diazotrophicus]|nr:MFS transporter [Gluconacetobacter diazotrophicus]